LHGPHGNKPPPRYHFCGSKGILLQNTGIALAPSGSDYSFCEDCPKCNSDYKFWCNFFDSLDYESSPEEEHGI
jgi:hypothetical protein